MLSAQHIHYERHNSHCLNYVFDSRGASAELFTQAAVSSLGDMAPSGSCHPNIYHLWWSMVKFFFLTLDWSYGARRIWACVCPASMGCVLLCVCLRPDLEPPWLTVVNDGREEAMRSCSSFFFSFSRLSGVIWLSSPTVVYLVPAQTEKGGRVVVTDEPNFTVQPSSAGLLTWDQSTQQAPQDAFVHILLFFLHLIISVIRQYNTIDLTAPLTQRETLL